MAEAKQFLPMSRAEMKARGWDELDVLIITGDAYTPGCEYIRKNASVRVSKDERQRAF